MDIGSIFLILALLLLVGFYIGRPLLEKKPEENIALNPNEHEVSALLAERDRLVNALKELEFDHLLGKIPEDQYPSQRASLMQRGADILRRLDLIEPDQADRSLEDQLEAAIEARRVQLVKHEQSQTTAEGQLSSRRVPGVAVAAVDDDLEMMLSNRKRARQEKAAGFCPKCGGPLQKSDRFCPKCGAKSA